MKFRREASAGLLVALLAGCAHPTRMEPAAARPDAAAINLADFDHTRLSRAIFAETNRVRVAHGLAPLLPLPALDVAADEQASYMALTLTVTHFNPIPGERTAAERIEHVGLRAAAVGENALNLPALRAEGLPDRNYTYAELAAACVEGWMNSPVHRESLLYPTFTHLGCAAQLATGLTREKMVFATQVFFRGPPP
jgi:uncharacterized protein YkwD